MYQSRHKYILLFFFLVNLSVFCENQNILEKLNQAVDQYFVENSVTGMSVSVIGRDNLQKFQEIINKGTISKKSSIPINLFTEFRLGPVSQVFTSILLAYFVNEGQINLNDPVSKFLPKSTHIVNYEGTEITIGDLATHTSGLPDMPYSLSSRASFSVSQMYRFLSKYTLTRKPGTQYEYSNLGYAFLSNLLSRLLKQSYSDLTLHNVMDPLSLKDTSFLLSPEQKRRVSTGYDGGKGVSPYLSEKIYSVFIGSGGVYSTPSDMLNFLSFNLGKEKTSLNSVLPIMQKAYHLYNSFDVGLGWKIIPYEDSKLFFAEGSLFGFTSFMGIIPEKDIGIVILSNHVDKSIEFLAHQLLDIMSSF